MHLNTIPLENMKRTMDKAFDKTIESLEKSRTILDDISLIIVQENIDYLAEAGHESIIGAYESTEHPNINIDGSDYKVLINKLDQSPECNNIRSYLIRHFEKHLVKNNLTITKVEEALEGHSDRVVAAATLELHKNKHKSDQYIEVLKTQTSNP